MRSSAGYTLIEILIVVALIAVVTGTSVPLFLESNARNQLWASTEQMGALVRQTRLKAISRNTTFEVRFNCPSTGNARGLIMTGDPLVDDAETRCSTTTDGDSEVIAMATGVAYDPDGSTGLQVNGRGAFIARGESVSIPLTIAVSQGSRTRYLRVSPTGQISFSDTIEDDDED